MHSAWEYKMLQDSTSAMLIEKQGIILEYVHKGDVLCNFNSLSTSFNPLQGFQSSDILLDTHIISQLQFFKYLLQIAKIPSRVLLQLISPH